MVRETRPGGRTARTTERVHRAVADLVAESGADRILVAEVAERSGVHATTIYRRWGSAEALLRDVAVRRLAEASPVPDTGSLRGDVLTYARAVAASVVRPEGLAFLRAVVTAGRTDTPQQAAAALDPRVQDLQAMLDRAGPDDPHLDIGDLFDGVLAPLYLRTLFGFADFTEPYLEDLVARLWATGGRRDRPVS